MHSKPTMVFFGTTNELSLAAFKTLLNNNCIPLAVFVTAESAGLTTTSPLEQIRPAAAVGELPLLTRFHEPTLIQAAWSANVPVVAIRDVGHQVTADLLIKLKPDAACVVCFPRLIPSELFSLTPFGFLNLHPSLLPHYRGPAPLFWLFRRADMNRRGVTIHQIDRGFDTGPIVKQELINFDQGLNQTMIERKCGELGGRLLIESLTALAHGHLPQPQTDPGSYDSWPTTDDFALNASWPAVRAFNFMRATDGYRTPHTISLSGGNVALAEALKVDPDGTQDATLIVEGLIARLQLNPGVLTARLAPI